MQSVHISIIGSDIKKTTKAWADRYRMKVLKFQNHNEKTV